MCSVYFVFRVVADDGQPYDVHLTAPGPPAGAAPPAGEAAGTGPDPVTEPERWYAAERQRLLTPETPRRD